MNREGCFNFRAGQDNASGAAGGLFSSSIMLFNPPKAELLVLLRHSDEISEPLFELSRSFPRAIDKADPYALIRL
jgi:hypothetical protein